MSFLSKILATVSMVCYLATSSIAAAHALPMMGSTGSSDLIALEATMPIGETVSQDEEVKTMMACHQDSNSSKDAANASGICKIFCSAIGHALLSTEQVEVVSKFHNTSLSAGTDSLTTRQLTVEQQPPK